jgi:pimeloyl-ACP methyl ester carboxylesterase
MSEHVELAGLRIWYERWGAGPPLVLLHGAFGSSAEWEQAAPALTEQFTVCATDTRGHGHTPDPGPISYDLIAADVAGFIETIIKRPTSIVGWSDGGIVSLLVALHRPDLVHKIVPVSANFHTNGLLPEARTRFEGLSAGSPALEHYRLTYEEVSPDGAAHWPEIVDKVKDMILSEPTLEAKELSAIEAPTLVLSADDDIMSLEHTIEMARSIPSAELAIVPGTSHFLHHEKPELICDLIRDFLLNEPATTIMPIRRTRD